MNIRATLRRWAPNSTRQAINAARAKFAPPPLEQVVLHDYALIPDPTPDLRLSLVIPSVAPKAIFGGIATGVDFLFALARAFDAQPRIVIDEFNDQTDFSYIRRAAERYHFSFDQLELVSRSAQKQPLPVRKNDLFLAYNWWVALNLRSLVAQQKTFFGTEKLKTMLYIVQDYEPGFYTMSSTHMVARAALDGAGRTFGIFNSHELHAYFRAQGHVFEREFVIPLRMSKSLKATRDDNAPKNKKILVYGRPNVPRNCFPAVIAGLRAFVRTHEEFNDWSIESAGGVHGPVDLGCGRTLVPLGKLAIEQYARALDSTAVGLSLMASPHPSYPPLEMAHFGVRAITNSYACKDLSKAHENIVSIDNVLPETIADALAGQCRVFLADRQAGWRSKSMLPDYFSDDSFPFMAELVESLRNEIL